MTRDADLLARVGDALLPAPRSSGSSELVVAADLVALAEPGVRAAIDAFVTGLGTVFRESIGTQALPGWRETFTLLQSAEAHEQHAGWITRRLATLTPAVRGRFETAASLDPRQVRAAREALPLIRDDIRDRVGDRILLLPSTPTVAPYPGTADQALRDTLLALTSIAGLGGLPALNVPLRTAEGLPCGVCLIAAPGRDRDLLDLARTFG